MMGSIDKVATTAAAAQPAPSGIYESGVGCAWSIARGTSIGASVGIIFHAVAGGGLRALGRKTLSLEVVCK